MQSRQKTTANVDDITASSNIEDSDSAVEVTKVEEQLENTAQAVEAEVESKRLPEQASAEREKIPVEQGVEKARNSRVPVENPKAEESLATDQNWIRLEGVFPNKEFSLCGYDSFTASPVRDTAELLLVSDDRDIPGQTFPRLKWKIQAEQPVELFEGCSAIFSYNNLAGGARIHMKVKGE